MLSHSCHLAAHHLHRVKWLVVVVLPVVAQLEWLAGQLPVGLQQLHHCAADGGQQQVIQLQGICFGLPWPVVSI